MTGQEASMRRPHSWGNGSTESDKIRTLVAAADARTQAALLSALKGSGDIEIVGATTDADVAVKVVRQRRPHVVVASLDLAPISGTEFTREVRLNYADVSVVLVAEQSGLGAFKSAMHVGASDFLVMPFDGDELPMAVRRAFHFTQERVERGQVLSTSVGSSVDGRIVVICGPKGGTGKTTVSTGVAVTASRLFPGQVSLIDLDLQFGNVDLFLNLESDRNLRSLGPVLQELDREAVNSVIQPTPTGLRVLLPPSAPEDAEMFHVEDLSALLLFFKRTSALTIVDTGGRIDAALIAAAQDADLLTIITTPELPALRDTAKFVETLERLSVTKDRIAVVVNHATRQRGFDPSIVARTLGDKPLIVLPFDPSAVDRAANQGIPVSGSSRGALAAAIESLTQEIVERIDSPHLGGERTRSKATRQNGKGRLVAAFAR
jgi:pilus assembly protein CpaE